MSERFHSNPLALPVLSPPIIRNGSSPLPAMRTKWLAICTTEKSFAGAQIGLERGESELLVGQQLALHGSVRVGN